MNINPYLEFIESCRNKIYEGLVTHKHHIIPKHMGGKDNEDNIIILSVDDHYEAHMKLALCFETSHIFRQTNISSAIKLKGSLITENDLMLYKESMVGNGNPNYGNLWSDDKRKKASERVKKWMQIPENKNKIKKPKSDSSKMGKSDKNGVNNPFYNKKHSSSTIKILSEKKQGVYKGDQNIPIIIDGIEYRSCGEASKILKIPMVTIRWRVISKNKKFNNYKYK